jgi:hypothetical protein
MSYTFCGGLRLLYDRLACLWSDMIICIPLSSVHLIPPPAAEAATVKRWFMHHVLLSLLLELQTDRRYSVFQDQWLPPQ